MRALQLAVIISVAALSLAIVPACQSSQQVDEDMIRRVSNRFNKKLPIDVNKETRLNSTFAGPGKRWTFVFTLVNTNASELSEAELRDSLEAKVQNTVCSAKETKVFVENGVTLVSIYRGKDGT